MKIKKMMIGLLVLLLTGCQTTTTSVPTETAGTAEENEKFITFLDEEFEAYVTSDPSVYHYTLKDGEAYGIEKPELTWGSMTLEEVEETTVELEAALVRLAEIDQSQLSTENQQYYDVIKRDYEDDIELNKYPLNPYYFSSSDGIQENFVVLLTEWVFYTEEDVQDYLVLLADVYRYFETAIEFGKMQIEEGYWAPEFMVTSSMESIEMFTSKVEDNALITTFNERLDELNLENAASYKTENQTIVKDSVLPAYQMVYDFLEENQTVYQGTGATIEYPNGKEYYEALFRAKTSSLWTPEDMMQLGEEYSDDAVMELLQTVDYSVIDDYYSYEGKEIPEATEVLDFLEEKMLQDYPQGPSVNYTASYLDPSVTSESTIAYYVSPPVDSIEENVIRINGSYNSSYLEFVNTLAHEGFPGHLYQMTYLYSTEIHPMMLQVDYIGYTEGWAMMAGNRAMNWIEDVPEGYTEVFKVDTAVGYIFAAVTDVQINYLGWSIEEVAEYNQASVEDVQEMYNYYIENQGSILPYGFGMLMFTLMEEEAEETLGENFDIVEYNQVLLDGGFRSFEAVQKDVDAYVEANK
ncbi:MAG: DUF885 family protein [Anaerorhabdus sp.]